MFDYKGMQALVAVIEEGGFERASYRLNISQSAVSQRIKQFEKSLSTPLLIRAQPMQLTQVGKQILHHYRKVQMLEQELSSTLNFVDADNRPRISVAVNADSLATWFMPALTLLFNANDYLLTVVIDDEAQTHKKLQTGEVLGCITTHEKPIAGCSSDYLGTMRYYLVANRDFVQTYFKNGLTPATLAKAPAVIFNDKDELHHKFLLKQFNLKPGSWPYHTIPSSESFLAMIVQGHGYGLVGHLQAEPLFQQHKLLNLLPKVYIDVPLYWQSWNMQTYQSKHIFHALNRTAKDQLFVL